MRQLPAALRPQDTVQRIEEPALLALGVAGVGNAVRGANSGNRVTRLPLSGPAAASMASGECARVKAPRMSRKGRRGQRDPAHSSEPCSTSTPACRWLCSRKARTNRVLPVPASPARRTSLPHRRAPAGDAPRAPQAAAAGRSYAVRGRVWRSWQRSFDSTRACRCHDDNADRVANQTRRSGNAASRDAAPYPSRGEGHDAAHGESRGLLEGFCRALPPVIRLLRTVSDRRILGDVRTASCRALNGGAGHSIQRKGPAQQSHTRWIVLKVRVQKHTYACRSTVFSGEREARNG